ncbi:MFS transporter [Siculibacillus lacustris]|uniref:MFS transporter n=1 Tax=Siculibacillus lacustris TaxID=1549641 RepID=A0A4Q9VHE5_9HYPH|nr:MFS transporter [Siculibacillus lacustris]TBW34414.1 MFS transporter [Siculibacillus lacustris]
MSPSTDRPAAAPRSAFPLWLIVACGCLIAALNFGPRSSMGFYLTPITMERGWSRETFALAMAWQNLLWGVGATFFGGFADRWGTAKTLTLGAGLYAAGILAMGWAPTPAAFHAAGMLVGFGVAGCSFGIVMGAFGRVVRPEQRTLVFGFATAAGSFGQFFFAPVTQGLITDLGWHASLYVLAALMGLIPLLAIPLRGASAVHTGVERDQSVLEAFREALGHRSFRLLVAGFFVCGFQVAFITTHFPAYLNDLGLDPKWGIVALMLIGAFNIVGSLGAGILGMRMPKRWLLALIYAGRSLVVTVFLLVPASPVTVVIFAALMGVLWLSTVPPTNALVALMFGTRWFAMLGGMVFFSHQIGSFLGVWLGGVIYDRTHSYDPVWWMGVALGLFAALVHLPIREAPIDRAPRGLPQAAE